MRTIRISEEVWDEIAKRGVFGETSLPLRFPAN